MKNGKNFCFVLYNFSGFATRAIHAGNNADPLHGGVTPAIDLSTTYI